MAAHGHAFEPIKKEIAMRTNAYIKFLFSGYEGRAYATLDTPKGVLAAILKALEFHGVTRDKIDPRVDLAKIEEQFAAIDAGAFRLVLNACDHHQLQIVLIEHGERPAGSGMIPRDRGTLFGPF